MTQMINRTSAIFAVFVLAFAFQACGPTSYKTQRNLVVNVSESHEENLARAEKIVGELDVAEIRKEIRAAFPDVTAEHLETFEIKASVLKIGETPNAVIETSLSFTDTSLPANEIMEFVHAKLQAAL
ncbi:MAG: hypothetical protein RIF32_00365 [Leptospirales bacterium]|jgi:DNA primase large subunit